MLTRSYSFAWSCSKMAPHICQNWRVAPELFTVLILALVTSGTWGETPPITEDFDVRPGGQVHSFSRTLGGYTCTFTYAAQGGTNEQWQMSLAVSVDGSLFSCSMYRPQGTSYLFFTEFVAKVEGGTIEHAQAYSHSDKDVPLKKEEYEVGETTVSHKQGVFKSSLAKIILIANSRHAEL